MWHSRPKYLIQCLFDLSRSQTPWTILQIHPTIKKAIRSCKSPNIRAKLLNSLPVHAEIMVPTPGNKMFNTRQTMAKVRSSSTTDLLHAPFAWDSTIVFTVKNILIKLTMQLIGLKLLEMKVRIGHYYQDHVEMNYIQIWKMIRMVHGEKLRMN